MKPIPQTQQEISQNQAFSIIVAAKISKPLLYINGSGLNLEKGSLVRVPLGKRTVTGIVLEQAEQTVSIDINKLREIDSLINPQFSIPQKLLDMLLWASRYYHAPIGQILSTALPKSLLQGKPVQPKITQYWALSDTGMLTHDLPPRQQQLQDWLQARNQASTHDIIEAGFGRHLINALAKRQRLEPIIHKTETSCSLLAEQTLPANNEQQVALHKLSEGKGVFLLNGVTGSGKTEVYFQAMESHLSAGRQILYLVPEIGLISQTTQRLKARFNALILGYHSAASESEKIQCWQQAPKPGAIIIVGTRSAVFLPFKDLAMIIIDEEQDSSYKQQDGFRYSARDLAIYRATQTDTKLILGSATPSLESLKNALENRYQILTLNQRAAKKPLPEWQLVKEDPDSPISKQVLNEIAHTLNSGNQVLVYINRRGFAPLVQCQNCGWQALCELCDTRMTLHKAPPALVCHRCERRCKIPERCPSCLSTKLNSRGEGTEQIEAFFKAHFEHIPCIRIDRDNTQQKEAFSLKLEQLKRGQPAILVGTQMITKGHHLPGISLVVCLGADMALYSHDFRAIENLCQTLIQVAGRAGRGSESGKVFVEAQEPEHPLLQDLATRSYMEIAQELLKHRQKQNMPPYCFSAIFHANSVDLNQLQQFMEIAHQNLKTDNIEILGPIPSIIERKSGRYRYQIQIYSDNRSHLHQAIASLEQHQASLKGYSKIRWAIDIDPLTMD